MKIGRILGMLPLTVGWFGVIGSSFGAAPFTDVNFDEASKQAAQSDKIVLVDFYTTWCGPCKMLDKNTWTDSEVIKLLRDKTVSLRLDAEKETALAKRYKIEAYPSVLLIKPDGTEIDRLVGYRDPKLFMSDFNAALAGKDSVARAKDKVTAAGTNNPSARMRLGQALAEKGEYPEALAEYLWCFDHGLEASPSFVGVRVSFLLMYMKNLADKYQPARQAMESRRDDREAKVLAGSKDIELIQDLVALNKTLEQPEKSLAVFDKLPANSKTREIMSRLLTEQFLEARRYADVIQGTDGKAAFKKAVDQYHTTLDSLGENPMRKQVQETLRRMAINQGTHYFEALAGLKQNQDGKDLAGQILQFDSSQSTRNFLADAAKRAGNTELAQYVKQ